MVRVYGTICHESVGYWVTYKISAANVIAVTQDPEDVSLQGFVRGEDGVLRACSDAGVEPTSPFLTARDFEPIYLCHTEADAQLVYMSWRLTPTLTSRARLSKKAFRW